MIFIILTGTVVCSDINDPECHETDPVLSQCFQELQITGGAANFALSQCHKPLICFYHTQALDVIRKLRDVMPIVRANMLLRVVCTMSGE